MSSAAGGLGHATTTTTGSLTGSTVGTTVVKVEAPRVIRERWTVLKAQSAVRQSGGASCASMPTSTSRRFPVDRPVPRERWNLPVLAAALTAVLSPISGATESTGISTPSQVRIEGRATLRGLDRHDILVEAWPAPTSAWLQRVVDPAEAPVGPLARSRTTVGDGRYVLMLPASRRYRLVASAPGFSPREIIVLPLNASTLAPPVELASGRECRLRVVNQDLVEGTRIALWSNARPAEDRWRGATQVLVPNESGTLIVHVGSAEHRITLPSVLDTARLTSADPSCDFKRADPGGGPGGSDAMVEKVGSIRTADNQTASDARVWVIPQPATVAADLRAIGGFNGTPTPVNTLWPLVPESLEVDPIGMFLVPDAPIVAARENGTEWTLAAWAPGHLPQKRLMAGPVDMELQLELEEAGELFGSVSDATGQPVDRATVSVAQAALQIAGAFVPSTTTTDSNGEYRLSMLPRSEHLRVAAAKPGFSTSSGRALLRRDGEPTRLDLVLQAPFTVRGRVTTPAGKGVQDAELGTVNAVDAQLKNGAPSRWPQTGSGWRGKSAITRSNRDGRFELVLTSPFADTQLSLVVATPGWAIDVVALPQPEPGQHMIDLGDIVLEPAASIEGIVVDGDGTPVDAADVSYARAGAESIRGPISAPLLNPAAAAMKGARFFIDGLRSHSVVNLRTKAPGFLPRTTYGVLPESSPVEIELERASTLRLRVEDQAGSPAQCSKIQLGPTGARGFLPTVAHGCTEDSEQRIHGLAPGPHLLVVGSKEHETYRSTVDILPPDQDQQITVRLEALGAEVMGLITVDDAPLSGAQVRLGTLTVVASAEGRFLLTTRTGDHLVHIQHPTTGAVTTHRVQFSKGLNEPVFDLSERRFTGWVTDSSGEPVPDAHLALSSSSSFDRLETMTRPDGSFSLSAIPDRYNVAVRSRLGELDSTADLRDRSATDQLLQLEGIASVDIAVLGLQPGERALVSYSRSPLAGGTSFQYRTEAPNPVVHLTFGEWYISAVVGSGRRRGYTTVELTAERPHESVEIQLGDDSVSGVVTVDGREQPGVAVFLVGSGDRPTVRSATTGGGGRFEFVGAEPGAYYVSTDTQVVDIRVPTAGPVSIEIETGTATVEVLDAATGLAIPNAQIEIWPVRVGRATAERLGAMRRYLSGLNPVEIGPVPSGAYRVRISGARLVEVESVLQVGRAGERFVLETNQP